MWTWDERDEEFATGYWQYLLRLYDRRYVRLASGEFYWHLYLRGEKVNGGLSPGRDEARQDSFRAIAVHAASLE